MASLVDEMRQHIDGGYALGDEVLSRLARIENNTRRSLVRDNFYYVRQTGNSLATTEATLTTTAPNGVDWLIERIACTGSVNGILAIYLDEVQPQNLIAFQPEAAINAWPESQGIYVPSGRPVIAHFYNQSNNQQVTLNYRVTEIKLEEDDCGC